MTAQIQGQNHGKHKNVIQKPINLGKEAVSYMLAEQKTMR